MRRFPGSISTQPFAICVKSGPPSTWMAKASRRGSRSLKHQGHIRRSQHGDGEIIRFETIAIGTHAILTVAKNCTTMIPIRTNGTISQPAKLMQKSRNDSSNRFQRKSLRWSVRVSAFGT